MSLEWCIVAWLGSWLICAWLVLRIWHKGAELDETDVDFVFAGAPPLALLMVVIICWEWAKSAWRACRRRFRRRRA